MKWFRNLFNHGKTEINDQVPKRHIGLDAYKSANELFHTKKIRDTSVLSQYDKAIDYGINEAYGDRAFCLQLLGYHYDALSDFSKAISLNKYDPNLYFGRATSRKSLDDLEGSVEDLKIAVSLAKIPSNENEELNRRANGIGWASAAAMYEMELQADLDELKFNNENPDIYERLKQGKKIKRRNTKS